MATSQESSKVSQAHFSAQLNLFDFRLIRQIPKPSGSIVFCLIFFALLRFALANDFFISLDELSGSAEGFVLQERSDHAEHPMILVGGSSRNGMGIHTGVLEQRTGVAAGKVTCSGGEANLAFNILDLFNTECQNVKLMIVDIIPISPVKNVITNSQNQFYEQELMLKEEPVKLHLSNLSERRPFIELYRKWKSRLSFQNKNKKPDHFENLWHQKSFQRGAKALQDQLKTVREFAKKDDLQSCADILEKIIDDSNSFELVANGSFEAERLDETRQVLFKCLDDCQQKGIYVVFNSTPRWYGTPCVRQSDIDLHSSLPFHRLLAELDQRPNCTVIACGYFEEIDPQAQEEDYLFDYGHMTEKGAALYTHWLMDRLLETREIAALFPHPVLAQPQPKVSQQFEP